MVGTSGIEKPKISKGKLTSEIIFGAVKTEYRQFGIGKRLIDEAIEIAKQMGVERVLLKTNYYEKHLTRMTVKKNFTLTGTIVEHKSIYLKTRFLAIQVLRFVMKERGREIPMSIFCIIIFILYICY